MKLNDILKVLHSNNDNAILRIINQSIYSDLYPYNNDSLVIHTGFTYSNHKSKSFDLLFDLDNKKLINQVRTPGYCLPLICGIIYLRKTSNDKFFGTFLPQVIFKYFQIDERLAFGQLKHPLLYMNETKEIKSIDIQFEKTDYSINSFEVEDENGNEISYPLNKIYNNRLYFNGDHYSFNSNFDDYYDEDGY